MTVLRAERIFTGTRICTPGYVEIRGERIAAVNERAPTGSGPVDDLGPVTLVPGFVDAHGHGGGGTAYADNPAPALALHRAHGTTTSIASLVSRSLGTLAEQLERLGPWVEAGELAGVHLEGPWLDQGHRGAHPASVLRDPDPAEVLALVRRGRGSVRMVTLAAERPGGLDAIRALHEDGVVAALGHTGADIDQTRAAIAAGVTGATHLFNAMPGLHHRAPGPVLALLDDDRVWLELIADGLHLAPAIIARVARLHPERVVLVSDAMAAAGMPDGAYALGELPVEVRDGVARIAGSDTLAGSTLTLDRAIRTAIEAGVDWPVALRAATVNPARYLGLTDIGELRPGAYADLVTLDPAWMVDRVWRRGRPLGRATAQ